MKVAFVVDGHPVEARDVAPDASLLDVLRDDLGRPGTKDACRQGECGSCTVLLDGRPVVSCLVHAVQARDRTVVTIEGLSPDGLSDLQQALVDRGAVQCGFCTPGIVVAAEELLGRRDRPSELEVREALSGNLCRCTGYQAIVDAVLDTAAGRARR